MHSVSIQVHRLGSGKPPAQLIQCRKCSYVSGDDWSQCDGSCPMQGSPHFDPVAERVHGGGILVEANQM